MNTNKVKDPPHLGFNQAEIEKNSKEVSKLAQVIKETENTLKIYTSTPNLIPKFKSIMDITFSKHVTMHIDNDSGYMSLNQESNSESVLEGFSANGEMISSNTKTVYLSEDALLERPEVVAHQAIVEPTDQDMFESNERIESSVGSENGYFNITLDNSESGVSDLSERSIAIPRINSIIITDKCANSVDICDISNDSNIENNVNVINTSNNTILLSNTSSYCDAVKSFDYGDKLIDLHSSSEDLNNKLLKPLHSSFTTSGSISRPQSPELFSDEEIVEDKGNEIYSKNNICKEKYVLKQDQKLIKRVQSTLSGVLPPPSLTTIDLTAEQMLERIGANKYLLCSETSMSQKNEVSVNSNETNTKCSEIRKNLLLTSSDIQCTNKKFPEIMEERYHGLHHNRSKLSEDFEALCMKYAERYIGCETQSTCTVFQQAHLSSPLKRKASRLRWAVKSPGRRLSHLARRRITFSSANLQTSAGTSALNAHTRQIAIDSKRFQLLSRKRSPLKKSPRKTPKKSPRKSPKKKIRTPSSSAKKRLSLQLQSISNQNDWSSSSIARASATKRALFQSPEKSSSSLSKSIFPSTSGTSSLSPFKKRVTPKCALFTSPSKKSFPKIDNKRKRTDSDDVHPSKLFRSVSLQSTGSTENAVKKELSKVKSETSLSTLHHSSELSAHHKKKLQWAVYEALRGQNIGINHPQFKQFASVLARVTRRFLPNLAANAPRPEGGTSDRMLRIARQHIYAVMKGKSVDEIIQDFEATRLKNSKPVGYIGLEPPRSDISSAKNKENVFRDRLNTMSNEKRKSGLNRDELIKTTLTRYENRVDRARRMINFDDENDIR